MNEACLNFLKKDISTTEGQQFTSKVLDFMRTKLKRFQQETDNFYNLEATPAEGTSYRLALIDKKNFSDIITANEDNYKKGKETFYTNSSLLPVNHTEDLFEALDHQDNLQTKYTGGTVLHTYLGEKIENSQTVKSLIKKVFENYSLPYLSITPTFSICPQHGYLAGEHAYCPKCLCSCEIYSRVTGYLRPLKQWNSGKQAEFKLKKNYKVNAFSKRFAFRGKLVEPAAH